MPFAVRHRYTLRDYLDVEETSAVRHEFIGGEIVAMAGGTPEHAALAAAVTTLLGAQLLGGRCRVYSSDLRLRVLETGLATYADASVVCGPPERDPASPTHVTNPTVVVEILSPGTEEYDRGEKRESYQRIPSLRAIVLVAHDRVRVEVFARGSAGVWSHTVFSSGETLRLEAVGCALAVDEVYGAAGVQVP
jgi:Uma2 family endonuclease